MEAAIEAIISTGISEADFLKILRQYPQAEVVNGRVVISQMTAQFDHGIYTRNVWRFLDQFASDHKLGLVLGDSVHYKLDETAEGLKGTRLPDVSFVRRERLKGIKFDELFQGAPDLAVEVVSPTEGETITLEKVRDYLQFGGSEVWVLYPMVGQLHVYRADTPKLIHLYTQEDTFFSPLFPDLEIKAGAFFNLNLWEDED